MRLNLLKPFLGTRSLRSDGALEKASAGSAYLFNRGAPIFIANLKYGKPPGERNYHVI
jgi:hypothetical protein